MPRVPHRSRISVCVGLLLLAACGFTRTAGSGALEPRFVAVHNALAAMGLVQVGPIQEGILGEGREARVALQLPAGCLTIVAIGGEGMRDVDATLLDSRGTPLAHDTTAEPQAVLRPCVEGHDAYVLVINDSSGAGSWGAPTWAGGATGTAPTPNDPGRRSEAHGECLYRYSSEICE